MARLQCGAIQLLEPIRLGQLIIVKNASHWPRALSTPRLRRRRSGRFWKQYRTGTCDRAATFALTIDFVESVDALSMTTISYSNSPLVS